MTHPPDDAMTARHLKSWESLDVSATPGDGPVAFCGDLSPVNVLGGYSKGLIPFPAADEYARDISEFRYEEQVAAGAIAVVEGAGGDPYTVAWWSPDPRPVIAVAAVHIGRNVRKRLRGGAEWTTTADARFEAVAEECRVGREPRWLTDALLDSLTELHRLGWVHSIEVWEAGELVGGAFGIAIGRTLSGDSLFSRTPGAARVAVADMAARFAEAGGTLIDAQWDSPFLRSLGAGPIPRERFLAVLDGPAEPLALPRQALHARRLLAPSAR